MSGDRYTIVLIDGEGNPIDLRDSRIKVVDGEAGIIQIRYGECEHEDGDICSYCGAGERKCKNCGAPR